MKGKETEDLFQIQGDQGDRLRNASDAHLHQKQDGETADEIRTGLIE